MANERIQVNEQVGRSFQAAQWAGAAFLLAFLAFSWFSYHGQVTNPVVNAYAMVAFQLVAYILFAGAAAYAAWVSADRARLAWGCLCASATCAALGIVVLVFFQTQLPQAQFTFFLFLVVNGVGLAGLFFLLPSQAHYERQIVIVLDALIIAGSLFCILWMTVFGRLYELSKAGYYERLTTVLYPTLSVIVLTLLFSVFIRTPQEVRAPVRYLLAGWCIAAVALPIYTYFALAGKVWAAYIGVGGALAAIVLDSLGALRVSRVVEIQTPPAIKVLKASQYAVYVPVAILVPVSIWHYEHTGGLGTPMFTVGIAVFVLLFARLVVAQREAAHINALLTESLAFKTQMMQFISHEIANPLTPLMVQKALMQHAKEQGDPLDQTAARNLEVFSRSLGRLESLSKDVRALAQLDAGKMPMDLHELDLVAETQKAVDAVRPAAEHKQLHLKFVVPRLPALARVDPQRYGQVVDNLLSNAMKFTQPNGSIDVAVVEESAGWTLIVQDTGAGLSPEQRDRLFTAFGRAHGNQAPGLGLGLFICKGIVEAHGGTITVDSQGPKRGTQFRVTLPAIAQANAAVLATERRTPE